MFGRQQRDKFRLWREQRARLKLKTEILDEVRSLLSLHKVTPGGVPNLSELNVVVRNMAATNLNLKFFGYELARSLAAALPVGAETVARYVGLESKASTQADMESDWVAHWCAQLLTPVVFHRKLWELAYVLQAFHENGLMQPGIRVLGFGCGQEPLPSYLAARGVAVTVTDMEADQAQAAGWAATGQHASSLELSYQAGIVDRDDFDRLVDLRVVDMNAIPRDLTGYDACWSICALEHLGSIERGLAFIEKSLDTVKAGGLAVHTTELNINPSGPTIDNWPTVLFQKQHFELVAQRLSAKGHTIAPLNFDIGDRPLDQFIDLPPWSHDLPDELGGWHGEGAHLKVGIDGFIATCFGIVIRKAG